MRSIILLGNGGCLSNHKLGKKIDEFDEVIRLNRFKCVGWEDIAGTKTTIWVTYNPLKGYQNFINDYTALKKTKEEMQSMVKDIRELWYINWKPTTLMEAWKNRSPLDYLSMYEKIKRHQSPVNSKKMQRKYNMEHPSTGYLLMAVLVNMYDKIYIHGFDIYEKGETHHYFGGESTKTHKSVHNFENSEYKQIKEWIKQGRVEFLEEDTEIEEAVRIDENKEMEVCGHCKLSSVLHPWENRICHHCENYL